MDPLQVLAQSELFAGTSLEDFSPLAGSGAIRHYDRGELIWATGDVADRLLLVLEGEVVTSRIGPEGDEYVVEVFVAGDVMGALHFFEPSRMRLLFARAAVATSCWIISRDAFMRLLDQKPDLMKRMLRTYSRWIVQRDLQDADASFRNLRGKVATKLLHLADRHGDRSGGGPQIRLRVTETTLASMIGASRENVSRAITQLQRSGDIRRERGHLILVQPEVLRRRYSWITDEEAHAVVTKRRGR